MSERPSEECDRAEAPADVPQDEREQAAIAAQQHAVIAQANRDAAVRHALGILGPQPDDGQQPYEEVLRRLYHAVGLALTESRPPGQPS